MAYGRRGGARDGRHDDPDDGGHRPHLPVRRVIPAQSGGDGDDGDDREQFAESGECFEGCGEPELKSHRRDQAGEDGAGFAG
ncbi:hypothetical protein ACFOJ6_13030 [Gordonia humi]|uniref:hypothetical protein n=1 Tax=Gordonia humi TaxID=686429 RepID=UPI00360ECB8E